MTGEPSDIIEALFPQLCNDGYSITSVATPEYNCIAWAAEDSDVWWEPDPLQLYYWPSRIPRGYNLANYIKAFTVLGYSECQDADHEEGYDKIAIYVSANGVPTHAARQLKNGCWTSKLGTLEDIEHKALDGLTGGQYGAVAVVMKRPVK